MIVPMNAPPVYHNAPVRLIRFGPQGYRLTVDTDYWVKVWDGEMLLSTLDLYSSGAKMYTVKRISDALFHPTEPFFFIAAADTLLAYDARTCQQLWACQPRSGFGVTLRQSLLRLNWAANGELLVTLDNGTIARVNPENGNYLWWQDDIVPHVFCSELGSSILIGTDHWTVSRVDLLEERLLSQFPLRERAFGFDADLATGRVAVRGLDHIDIWDVQLESHLGRAPSPTGSPVIAFIGSDLIATTSTTGLDLWSCAGSHVAHLSTASPANCLALHPEGHIWAGCQDGTIQRWGLEHWSPLAGTLLSPARS